MVMKNGEIVFSDYERDSYVPLPDDSLRQIYPKEILDVTPEMKLNYLIFSNSSLEVSLPNALKRINNGEGHLLLSELEQEVLKLNRKEYETGVKSQEPAFEVNYLSQKPKKNKRVKAKSRRKNTARRTSLQNQNIIKEANKVDYARDRKILTKLYEENELHSQSQRYKFLRNMATSEKWGEWAEEDSPYSLRTIDELSPEDKSLALSKLEQLAEIEIATRKIMEILNLNKTSSA